jgi:hypothetical protein
MMNDGLPADLMIGELPEVELNGAIVDFLEGLTIGLAAAAALCAVLC